MSFSHKVQSTVLNLISSSWTWIIVTIVLSLAISFQLISLDNKTFEGSDGLYKHYNVFIIYKTAFEHLQNDQNMYLAYPDEYWDLYKYSPGFAVFMGVFSFFNDETGVVIWNLLNALIFTISILSFPFLAEKQKGLVLLLCLPQLINNLQNTQVNALICGLLILSFYLNVQTKRISSAFSLVSSVFIKPFGIVFGLLYLLKKDLLKYVLLSVVWGLIFLLLPLVIVDIDQLIQVYKDWIYLLQHDFSDSPGMSVFGWLNSWFGLTPHRSIVLGIGGILLLLPLYRRKLWNNRYYMVNLISSMLIWVVIFNYRAESPSFILAVTGATIWLFNGKKSTLDLVLYWASFFFGTLVYTDLIPWVVKDVLVEPYTLKAVPFIFIWFKILYECLGKPSFPETQIP